jgi:uncharacterized short protein YbdD (DUF466 family)
LKAVHEFFRKFQSTVKTILGMPDYAKYTAHHQAVHPEKPLMTEQEYYLYALKHRYDSGQVNRCC